MVSSGNNQRRKHGEKSRPWHYIDIDVIRTAAVDDNRFKRPMRWLKAANFRKRYRDLAQT
jgi:hypothetical protein